MSDTNDPTVTTFEKQVLRTRRDLATGEDVPIAWVEHGEVVCAPPSGWAAANLFANGFRWKGEEKTLLAMKDGPVVAGGSPTQARQIVSNTLRGGLG